LFEEIVEMAFSNEGRGFLGGDKNYSSDRFFLRVNGEKEMIDKQKSKNKLRAPF
jgi:hypothetical protein